MLNYSNYINQNYYNSAYNNNCPKNGSVEETACEPTINDNRNKINSKTIYNKINEIPFNPTFSASQLRTQLSSGDEQNKYNVIQKGLDKQTRKGLELLLKNGTLLNTNSTNNSSVLDNLYNIMTTPRATGLNSKTIATDVINTLNNPFLITQQFGDIPSTERNNAINTYISSMNKNLNDPNIRKQSLNDISVSHSGTCVAASIEFNLAQDQPAEFARFAEGLSSPNLSVEKVIHLDKLADNTLDAVWLLNAFEVPYKADNFDTATLTFKPDNTAIVRANIQTNHKDPEERTPLDVLMQSTFMQVGSQQSYNTLSDKRAGKFNQNDKGLIEFEKTFVESVVEDKNKISVTYQNVDENARLVGYETDMNTLKKHITSAIDSGENVIIGYTQTDDNNIIINGHEITIVGYKKDNSTGKYTFICNDTDDNLSKPIEYDENYLLPKIHHAALPQHIIKDELKMVENWVEGLNAYKQQKEELKQKSAKEIPINEQTNKINTAA